MTRPAKAQICAALLASLADQIAVLEKAVANAVEGTTHAESKQEDKHDTRAIEAGYLAGAQLERLKAAQARHRFVSQLAVAEAPHDGPIRSQDLVELTTPTGKSAWYFILPMVEGDTLAVGDESVRIVSAQSTLGEQLLGLYVGDEVDPDRPERGEVAAIV